MVILKIELGENVAMIYNKIAQPAFALVNTNNNDIDLIKQIENSSFESGIIYYAGL